MLKSKFTLGALSLSLLFLAGCSGTDDADKSSAEMVDSGNVTAKNNTHTELKEAQDDLENAKKPEQESSKKNKDDGIANKTFAPQEPADRSEYVVLQPETMILINAANTDLIEKFDTTSLNQLSRTEYDHIYALARDILIETDVFEKKELESKLDEALAAAKAEYEGKLLVSYTVQTHGNGSGRGLNGYDFDAGGFQIGSPYISPGAEPTGTFGFNSYKWVTLNAKDLMFYPVPDIEQAKSIEAQRASPSGINMVVYGSVTKIGYSASFSKNSFTFEITPHYIDFTNPRTGELILSSSQ